MIKNTNNLFRKESYDRANTLIGVPLFSETKTISRYLYVLLLALCILLIVSLAVPVKNTVSVAGVLTTFPPVIPLENSMQGRLLGVNTDSPKSVIAGDTLFTLKPVLSEQEVIESNAELTLLRLRIESIKLDIKQSQEIYDKETARLKQELAYNKKLSLTLTDQLATLDTRIKFLDDHLAKLRRGGATIYQEKAVKDQHWDIEDSIQSLATAKQEKLIEIQRISRLLEINESQYTHETNILRNKLEDAISLLDVEENKAIYRVKAPVGGRFRSSFTSTGHILEAGTNLGYIVQDEYEYFVEVSANESQVNKISVGQGVTLETDLFPKNEYGLFEGRVHSLQNRIEPQNLSGLRASSPFIVKVKIEDEVLIDLLAEGDIYTDVFMQARITTDRKNLWKVFFERH